MKAIEKVIKLWKSQRDDAPEHGKGIYNLFIKDAEDMLNQDGGTMHEKFEMIQHFACQIIKASLERNLVNATHYHAKIDRILNELYDNLDTNP